MESSYREAPCTQFLKDLWAGQRNTMMDVSFVRLCTAGDLWNKGAWRALPLLIRTTRLKEVFKDLFVFAEVLCSVKMTKFSAR